MYGIGFEKKPYRRAYHKINLTKEERDSYAKRRLNGERIVDLAREANCSTQTILKMVQAYKKENNIVDQNVSDKAVMALYSKGYTALQISKSLHASMQDISDIITRNTIVQHQEESHLSLLTTDKLDKFRDTQCYPGSTFKIYAYNIGGRYVQGGRSFAEVTVIRRHKYIAETDKGDFQYFDLYKGTKVR